MSDVKIDTQEFISDILKIEKEYLLDISGSNKSRMNIPTRILDLYEEKIADENK